MKKRLPLSIVIPTKDRHAMLIRILNYLQKNTFFFNEVLIIDSSTKNIFREKEIKNNFKKLNIKYYNSKPSTSIQRNLGLKQIKKKNKFIMFLDDDIEFYNNAFKIMHKFLATISTNIVGVGFNSMTDKQYTKKISERIKNSDFFYRHKIYNSKPGVVAGSGWHTKILNIKKNTFVDWLPTQACIYKIKIIKSMTFCNQLGKYAYLEDLIFSHEASKKGKLIINSKAKFKDNHHVERNSFYFGILEIKNRIIFIKKNNIKISNFLIAYIFFITKNLFSTFYNIKNFMRFLGNIIGIFYLIATINIKELGNFKIKIFR